MRTFGIVIVLAILAEQTIEADDLHRVSKYHTSRISSWSLNRRLGTIDSVISFTRYSFALQQTPPDCGETGAFVESVTECVGCNGPYTVVGEYRQMRLYRRGEFYLYFIDHEWYLGTSVGSTVDYVGVCYKYYAPNLYPTDCWWWNDKTGADLSIQMICPSGCHNVLVAATGYAAIPGLTCAPPECSFNGIYYAWGYGQVHLAGPVGCDILYQQGWAAIYLDSLRGQLPYDCAAAYPWLCAPGSWSFHIDASNPNWITAPMPSFAFSCMDSCDLAGVLAVGWFGPESSIYLTVTPFSDYVPIYAGGGYYIYFVFYTWYFDNNTNVNDGYFGQSNYVGGFSPTAANQSQWEVTVVFWNTSYVVPAPQVSVICGGGCPMKNELSVVVSNTTLLPRISGTYSVVGATNGRPVYALEKPDASITLDSDNYWWMLRDVNTGHLLAYCICRTFDPTQCNSTEWIVVGPPPESETLGRTDITFGSNASSADTELYFLGAPHGAATTCDSEDVNGMYPVTTTTYWGAPLYARGGLLMYRTQPGGPQLYWLLDVDMDASNGNECAVMYCNSTLPTLCPRAGWQLSMRSGEYTTCPTCRVTCAPAPSTTSSVSMTSTPSPTPVSESASRTNTPSTTQSGSPSATPTISHSATRTRSRTRTRSASDSATASPTISRTTTAFALATHAPLSDDVLVAVLASVFSVLGCVGVAAVVAWCCWKRRARPKRIRKIDHSIQGLDGDDEDSALLQNALNVAPTPVSTPRAGRRTVLRAVTRRAPSCDIFISYGPAEESLEFARLLRSDLAQHGFNSWMELGGQPGRPEEQMERCTAFICVINADFFQSSRCKDELRLAKLHRKSLFPCFTVDIMPTTDIKLALALVNWTRFDLLSYTQALAALIVGLEEEQIPRTWDHNIHAFLPDLRRAEIVTLLALKTLDPQIPSRRFGGRCLIGAMPLHLVDRVCYFVAGGTD